MSSPYIAISVGREFGSGGKEISIELAKRLGINCYDNELLSETAKNSGLDQTIIRNNDETPRKRFLYSMISNSYSPNVINGSATSELPLNHKVFLAQFDTIREIASKESCVIIGRCADYALADYENCCSIFVHAPIAFRRNRVKNDVTIKDDNKILDYIHKIDKKRASYYNYYSGKDWGKASSYHLCLDSSKTGIDGAVELILAYLKLRFPDIIEQLLSEVQ